MERRALRRRLVSFPLTYAAHLVEELWGGEGFPSWFSRALGAHLSQGEFLVLNAVAFVAMCAAAALAWRRARWLWLEATLGAIVAINALAHLVGALATQGYCPGLLTALALWAPLGVSALRHALRTLPLRQRLLGLAAGVLAHALVTLAELTL